MYTQLIANHHLTCRKDHEEVEDETICPPTKPICGVTGSATDRLSYILSTILSEIWKRDTRTVCMSTEELKAEIDRVNLRIGNKDIIVFFFLYHDLIICKLQETGKRYKTRQVPEHPVAKKNTNKK